MWRFQFSPLPMRRVKDLWPDVGKSIIYREMLDYGVDVKEIPVVFRAQSELGAVMATGYGIRTLPPRLFVATDTLDKAYPDDESKYIGLVHELAHFRQLIVGGLPEEELPEPPQGPEWFQLQHEQEAIRWSARQAKLMGWSEQRLTKLFERRYGHHGAAWLERVVAEGRVGFRIHPQQETLTLLQRRPVSVRSHVRRRR